MREGTSVKKTIALLAALLMLCGALAGCSGAEIGYLELSNAFAGVTSGEISGKAEVKLNYPQLMRELFLLEEEDWDPGDEIGGEAWNKTFSISYEGDYSIGEDIAYDLALQCGVNGKTFDLGRAAFNGNGDAVVTKQTLYGLLDLMEELRLDGLTGYAGEESFRAALEKALEGVEYIGEADLDALDFQAYTMQFAGLNGLRRGTREAAAAFLKDAHKGFSSELVKRAGGGYNVQLTLRELPDLLGRYARYMEANEEDYNSALEDYSRALAEDWEESGSSGLAGDFGYDRWSALIEVLPYASDFAQELSQDEMFKALGDSYYKEELSRRGCGYLSKVELGVVINKQTPIRIKTEAEVKPKPVRVKVPQAQLSMDEVQGVLEELSGAMNPVTGGEISWSDASQGEPGYAYVSVNFAKADPIWSGRGGYHVVEFQDKGGVLFVKLSDICQALEEKLLYNENIGKAYIEKNGKFIYLDGFQKDQRTWIKIRELEKLGYDISYRTDGQGGHVAVLERKQ